MWKRTIGSVALSAGLLMAGPAWAQNEPSVTGNIALATDYVFRGISQTGENPAIRGGFDYTHGSFYLGTWASNIDFEELGAGSGLELDLYGGWRPQVGQVTLDLGVIGYFYPGVTDIQAGPAGEGELDYVEGYAKASVSPAERWTLGAALYYSPEFTGETGEAFYVEAKAAYAVSDALSISGAAGYQTIDDVSGEFPGEVSDEYATWNVGATYTLHGFAIDLRYVGADIEPSDDLDRAGLHDRRPRRQSGVALDQTRAVRQGFPGSHPAFAGAASGKARWRARTRGFPDFKLRQYPGELSRAARLRDVQDLLQLA